MTDPKRRTLEEEKDALDEALDAFTNDMRARLYEMAERGKRGWDDPALEGEIATDCFEDAHAAAMGDRHHLHDIANHAMMLWWGAYGKDSPPRPTDGQD